jgi:23S rRNA-/tRNA-specific pseudouridylate synthase
MWVMLNRLGYENNPHQSVDQKFNRDSKSANTKFQTLEKLSNEYSIVRACIQDGQNELY